MVNRRELSPREWAVDIALAVGVFLLGCAQLVLGGSSFILVDDAFRSVSGVQSYMFSFVSFVFLGLMSLALVFRRIVTWPVFLFVFITYLVGRYQMGGQDPSFLAPCLALFTMAAERSRWEVVTAAIVAASTVIAMATPGHSAPYDINTRIQMFTYFGVALFMGASVHGYRLYRNEAESRLAEAEVARETEAQRRVEEERVRIAREIHDITAHSLSAVSIQAAAAERIVGTDPDLAREALRTIRDTSKSSLNEIRAMIGVLRGEGEPAESMPTHGTEHLDDLVHYLRDAGIVATCDASGYRREAVPLYLDVGVFGIAREAVTNIVKHAKADHAQITLHATTDLVTLMVVDDGKGMGGSFANMPAETDATRHGAGGGHGLQGMAERAHLLGGSFEAYDVDGGGFAVVVRIPYREKDKPVSGDGTPTGADSPTGDGEAAGFPLDAASADLVK